MKKTATKLLAALLALTLLLGCAALAEPAEAPDEIYEGYAVTGNTYPLLLQFSDAQSEPYESEMTLYFVNGGDIPYVALSEYIPYLAELYNTLGKGDIVYEISTEGEDDLFHFEVTRPDNGSMLFVFPEKDTLTFTNYNAFTQTVGSKILVSAKDMPEAETISPMDLMEMLTAMSQLDAEGQEMAEEVLEPESEGAEAPAEDMPAGDAEAPAEDMPAGDAEAPAEEAGAPSLFALKQGMYVNRNGSTVTLNLADYLIDIVEADGECYIPFQTMNDLLLCDDYMQSVFDGERIIVAAYGCSLFDELESSPKHDMSEEFAMFNFQELCLLLDCKYGLKPEHDIDSFSEFFVNNEELFQNLISTDPMRSSYAIANLCFTYFDDLHSALRRPSYMFERNTGVEGIVTMMYFGPSMKKNMNLGRVYENARKAVYRAWVPGYEEVGDTAFITFDLFTMYRPDYYDLTIDRDNPQDTVDLIIYANSQIKREGSPIKNIVIDLSNNGGGNADAAIFVMSWFLGEADMALRDTFTGAETNAVYLADVNLDGKYDEQDNVANGYRLYCLTTNSSFSCGNLVPAACRSSGKVTLIGQTTGGGSCVVLPCTTAAGALFQISGSKQISIIRNGSFYNTDAGVEPDFRLDKPESYYDRPALVEYLHNLK